MKPSIGKVLIKALKNVLFSMFNYILFISLCPINKTLTAIKSSILVT